MSVEGEGERLKKEEEEEEEEAGRGIREIKGRHLLWLCQKL